MNEPCAMLVDRSRVMKRHIEERTSRVHYTILQAVPRFILPLPSDDPSISRQNDPNLRED